MKGEKKENKNIYFFKKYLAPRVAGQLRGFLLGYFYFIFREDSRDN